MIRNYGYWLLAILLVLVAIGLIWVELSQKVARSPVEPQSLVTTFKGDPKTSRAFTWHTGDTKGKAVLQVVKGTSEISFEGDEVLVFQGSTTTLEVDKGIFHSVHKVEASGLEPGTTYMYRAGDGSGEGWSEPAAFKTEAQNTGSFTFINVTDSQGIKEQDFDLWGKTLNKAFDIFPEAAFIVHNGDLTEYPEDEEAWRHFFDKARPWVRSYPLMPVTGNHEQVDKNADRFVSHFDLPANGSASSITGTSYSFDYGPVHVVVLNTESKAKDQAQWLRSDLEASDKKWIIAAIHRPAYGGSQDESVLKRWVPVFDEFGVDLVLQGHNHEYSRSYPLKEGKIVESGGTVYATVNTSGPKFNEKKDDQYYHQVHFQNINQMFAGIHIEEDRLTYKAYDVDGKLLDEFILKH
ncbi:fibronectin type III domain-containing protein [Paenibacillus mendelii]|uniref:Fibronectin type III domain-containing protein n=1 Tax=Paenibacillus mendelii TaxID=206163 RepID=A0ABV6JE27_9BACL|nr:metallophosphoesterase family protein [Paenibacillus mendelii]MCQ6560751.1 metallophosphoesterase family protein [Paenibacillus mendelii]